MMGFTCQSFDLAGTGGSPTGYTPKTSATLMVVIPWYGGMKGNDQQNDVSNNNEIA